MSKETLGSQLSKVKKAVLKIKTVHNPGMWKKEGQDHININKYSETKLGQMLSLDSVRHWEHSLLGPFRSLNSLWFFLKAKYKSDEIRNITGFELKNFIIKRCGGQIGRIPHFRAVILDSAYQRAKSNPDIVAAIVASDLPFDCYRVMPSGVCLRFEHSEWFTRGYEEIRDALKEKREPNFQSFRDPEKGDIYDAVLAMVSPNHSELAKQAQVLREATDRPKKGKAAYDGSKITNIDNAPLKTTKKPEVQPEKPVAKEVLPDYKVAVDPGVGTGVAVAVVRSENDALVVEDIFNVPELNKDKLEMVASAATIFTEGQLAFSDDELKQKLLEPEAAAAAAAVVEQPAVEVPVPTSGEKPLNALQLALQSSGLVAEEQAAPVEAAVVPEATGRYSPD